MTTVDVMIESAKEDADGDSDDKAAAKKKVSELKSTLKKLKDQVIKEAKDTESADSAKALEKGARITKWVKAIAKKIPVITKLEKKLGMLQGLDPVLEGIVKDLERITDFSKLIALQKK